MRYPEGHKETVRARIVKQAARALRRQGLAGVSIPALMKKAGLTHGGFYSHFKNRDDLVVASVQSAAAETAAAVLSEDVGDIRATLDVYLSREHAAHPERGCVLAALGTEGRRHPAPIRAAFAEVARGFIAAIDSKLRKTAAKKPSQEALLLACQMVGGIVLARIVDDQDLADRILKAAKAYD